MTRQASLEAQSSQVSVSSRYVIIGNGISGFEAARRTRSIDPSAEIFMISRESTLHWSRPALMYLFMRELTLKEATPYPKEWFERHRITLMHRDVTEVDRPAQRIIFSNGDLLKYDVLLLALGSKPRPLQVPGALGDRVMGLYHLQDLDRLASLASDLDHILIVGGGLIAVEWAEMMLSRDVKVDIVIRDSLFAAHLLHPEEAEMITDYLLELGINIYRESEITQIDEGEMSGSLVAHLSTGDRIKTNLVGVAIGVQPAIGAIKGIESLCRRGVWVNQSLQSHDPRVFAAGDCAEVFDEATRETQSTISGTWYESRAMGKVAAASMTRSVSHVVRAEGTQSAPAYRPRAEEWFNSAKFFEVEYQIYGEGPSGHQETIFWRHPDRLKSLRLFFRSGIVVGFVSLRIRLRHETCHRFIVNQYSVHDTIEHLNELCFDGEFDHTLRRAQRELKSRNEWT